MLGGEQTFWNRLGTTSQTIEEAKKKSKPKKYADYKYIGRKRKKTFKPSQRQDLITKLLKKNVATVEEVMAVMINEGFNGEKNDAAQLLNIVKLKNSSGRITIPKDFLGGDIEFTVLMEDIRASDKMTTDLLYWVELLNTNVKAMNIASFIELSKIRISSTEAVELPTIDVEEYYVNDNNVEMSAPFLKLKPGEDLNEIAKKYVSAGDFSYNGKSYKKWSNSERPGEDVYKSVGSNLEDFINTFTKTERLYTEKGVLKKGFKKISRKGGYYYFDREFRPTTFCPVTIEFGKQIEFYVTVTFRINPDAYMKYCVDNNTLIFTPKMVSFDNFNQFIRLIELIVVMLGGSYPDGSQVKELVTFVNDNIEAYNAIRRHYVKFVRIALDYLESFAGKINVDRLNKILENINVYIADEGFLRASSVEIEAMKKASSVGNVFALINNYLQIDTYNAVLLCKKVLETIVLSSGSISNELLEQNVRAAGLAFFQFLLVGNKPCIDTVRSPAIFLNNLVGSKGNYNALNTIISTFTNEQEIANLSAERRNDEIAKYGNMVKMGTARKMYQDLSKLLTDPNSDQLGNVKQYLLRLGNEVSGADGLNEEQIEQMQQGQIPNPPNIPNLPQSTTVTEMSVEPENTLNTSKVITSPPGGMKLRSGTNLPVVGNKNKRN